MPKRSDELPRLSVIVPIARSDVAIARVALKSIERTQYPKEKLDVSLALDGVESPCASLKGYVRQLEQLGICCCYSLTQQRFGISAARNAAVRQSKGDYLFFLDADDSVTPTGLLGLARSQLKTGGMVVYGDHVRTTDSNLFPAFLRRKAEMHRLLHKYWLSEHSPLLYFSFLAPGFLVNRELFYEVGGFDNCLQCGELIDFLLRLEEACSEAAFVHTESVVYVYRQRSVGVNSRGREDVVMNNQQRIEAACRRRGLSRRWVRLKGKFGKGFCSYYCHGDKFGEEIRLPYAWP